MNTGKIPIIVQESLLEPQHFRSIIKECQFSNVYAKISGLQKREAEDTKVVIRKEQSLSHWTVLNLADTLTLKFHLYLELCFQVNLFILTPFLPEYEGFQCYLSLCLDCNNSLISLSCIQHI